MKLNEALAEYLKRSGEAEAKQLGDEQATSVTGSTQWLRTYLAGRVQFNDRLVIAAIGLLVFLFLTAVALAVYYRDHPVTMGSILGGDFVSMLSIVAWIWKIIVEKTRIDLAIAVVEGLPPEQAAAFIQTMYESMSGSTSASDHRVGKGQIPEAKAVAMPPI